MRSTNVITAAAHRAVRVAPGFSSPDVMPAFLCNAGQALNLDWPDVHRVK
jgi:hypothetical protein